MFGGPNGQRTGAESKKLYDVSEQPEKPTKSTTESLEVARRAVDHVTC